MKFKATDIDVSKQELILQKFETKYKGIVIGETTDFNLASLHVESYIMHTPIPSCYISFEYDTNNFKFIKQNKFVDSLINFMNDKFELQNLEIMPFLNGKKYSELDLAFQRSICEHYVKCYLYVGYNNSPVFDYIKQLL